MVNGIILEFVNMLDYPLFEYDLKVIIIFYVCSIIGEYSIIFYYHNFKTIDLLHN